MLASEYGWSKNHILNDVYPTDLFWLVPAMSLRQIDNVIMDVRVATNPHLEQDNARLLLDELLAKRRMYAPEEQQDREFDKSKLDELKQILKSPRRRSPKK